MRVLLIEDDSATAQSIELMLKTEAPGSPLRRYPRGGDHDQYNDEDGAPKDLGCRHRGRFAGC